MSKRKLHILLVEDDDVDVEAFERARARCEVPVTVEVAGDGIAALEILRGQWASPSAPSVIVLDLKLPRMNGLEFLSVLRQDEALKDKAVYVLSTSSAERDIEAAQELGISGYMVKSGRISDLVGLITKIAILQKSASEESE